MERFSLICVILSLSVLCATAPASSRQKARPGYYEDPKHILTAERYESKHPFDVLHLALIDSVALGVITDPYCDHRVRMLVLNPEILAGGRDAWMAYLNSDESMRERGSRGYGRNSRSTVLLLADFFGPKEIARAKMHPGFYKDIRELVVEHDEYLAGVFYDADERKTFFEAFELPIPEPTEPEDPHKVKPLPMWTERFWRLELPEIEGWNAYDTLTDWTAWGGSFYARYGWTASIEFRHLEAYEVLGLLAYVLEEKPQLLARVREHADLWEKLHTLVAVCKQERFARYMIGESPRFADFIAWLETNRPDGG